MRLLDLFRRPEQKTVSDSLDLMKEIYGGRTSWAGKAVTLDTTLQVSTALACARVIAEGVAMLPWKVYKSSGRITEVQYNHALHDKLSISPNPLQTAMEFQETIGLHLAFFSAAYVWIPRVSGRIDAFYALDPRWVTVDAKWPELPQYKIRFPDGRQTVLRADEVWHIRGPSWDGYTGLQFLTLAREAMGLSMALEEGQAKLQSQGVSMPGYLSLDGSLTEEQQKKLTKWISENHSGSLNSGKPMILDKGAKWLSTAMSNVDAQMLEQRRFLVEEVCRFMRVLPIMVGHADKTATYASAEQMFLAHAMYTLGPWARRLEQSATKYLLTAEERAQGLYTKLNEKSLLRMSAKDQADVLSRYTAAGIMTRNEGRETLELNPIDGLDEPLTPMNTVAGQPPTVDDGAAEQNQKNEEKAAQRERQMVSVLDRIGVTVADAIKSSPPRVDIQMPPISVNLERQDIKFETPAPQVEVNVDSPRVNIEPTVVNVTVPPPRKMEKTIVRDDSGRPSKLVEQEIEQ